MRSILSFDHYDVLETVYKYNPLDENENNEFSPKFDVHIKYKNKEKTDAMVLFSIEFGDEKLKEYSLYIKVRVVGFFSVETEDGDEINEETINILYRKNTLAILFPYIRSLVSDLSSKGSESSITLPPINIADLVETENLITETTREDNKNEEIED